MGGASAENLNITSPPITDWGNWGILENCPNGTYAQGFQLKTEHNQYLGDDTALNAIKLFCGDPNRPNEPTIMSTEGDFGQWGKVFTCYPGVLNGFQLRVESERGPNGDNTATNNIRFFCSTRDPDDYIQGDGMAWGTWGISRHCYRDQGICGIMTQVQPYQGSGITLIAQNLYIMFIVCQVTRFENNLRL